MNKKIIIGVVAVLVVVGLWWALADRQSGSASPSALDGQAIKLGIMMPLTGQFGAIGEGVSKAAQLAIEDYRLEYPNLQISFVEEDDKLEPRVGLGVYTKLTTIDKVDALLMISTPVLDAMYEKVQADGLPIAMVGLQNNGVERDNVFQLSADANTQIKKLAQYIEQNGNHAKLGVVHSTNFPALIGFYETFKQTYTKNYDSFLINSQADAKTVATRIAAAGVDGVVIMTDPTNGSTLTKELLILGVTPDKVKFYYDAQLQTGWPEYEKQIGDMSRLDGTLLLQFTTTDLSAFAERYQARWGIAPTPFAEYGYDGVKLLLDNYMADKKVWVQNMEQSNFMGYSGEVTFDNRGVRLQGTEVWMVSGGQVVKR